MARLDGASVRLITRHGNDFTSRFTLAAVAVAALPAHSFLLDGEAIVTDDRGLAVFGLVRRKRYSDAAVLVTFDLIELDGRDLRREPIEQRKHLLAKLVRGPDPAIVLNEHYEGDGGVVFQHACKLGCEGIVSKRADAFDDAWRRVKQSKAPWASEDYWTAGRTILARYIITMAKGGERDANGSQTARFCIYRNKN